MSSNSGSWSSGIILLILTSRSKFSSSVESSSDSSQLSEQEPGTLRKVVSIRGCHGGNGILRLGTLRGDKCLRVRFICRLFSTTPLGIHCCVCRVAERSEEGCEGDPMVSSLNFTSFSIIPTNDKKIYHTLIRHDIGTHLQA